jgi:hypothetical protein
MFRRNIAPTLCANWSFDLPNNMAFTFIIRIFWQFHAVTALRFILACHDEQSAEILQIFQSDFFDRTNVKKSQNPLKTVSNRQQMKKLRQMKKTLTSETDK